MSSLMALISFLTSKSDKALDSSVFLRLLRGERFDIGSLANDSSCSFASFYFSMNIDEIKTLPCVLSIRFLFGSKMWSQLNMIHCFPVSLFFDNTKESVLVLFSRINMSAMGSFVLSLSCTTKFSEYTSL